MTTPFETAVGTLDTSKSEFGLPLIPPLGSFGGAFPILSLRTNKADVVVDVPQEVADKLDAAGEKWRVNGK